MFQGTMTAIVTPFRGGVVDEEALRKLVHDQIAGGVDVLVPCGTTGEGATLTPAESVRVVSICVEEAKGRVPVVAGVGSNSTATTIENTKRAKEAGAAGALVVTPYYNKPSQEGLYRHFEAVAKEGGLPVVLYNVPSRTSVDMTADTVARLAGVPGIVAVKEATGTVTRTLDILEALDGKQFAVIAGDDANTLAVLSVGGVGVISVAANIVPDRVAAIVRAFRSGDLAGARAAQLGINGLVRALFSETNPVPCKMALALLGRMSEEVRLPLAPGADATRERMRGVLTRMGVLA